MKNTKAEDYMKTMTDKENPKTEQEEEEQNKVPQEDDLKKPIIKDKEYFHSKAHEKANCTLMILTGATLVAAILLVSWCGITKTSNSCDLQEAVKSLRLNFTVSCKYENSKENIERIWAIGISAFVLDFIFLTLSLIFWFLPPARQRTGYLAFYFMDYGKLKSAMNDSLQNYASDVITTDSTISDCWNNIFIKYDCCAVNQVVSTTNDFDTTPWCTTSGSCQLTNSQIPKSCCKAYTVDDYDRAPDICHATVNAGTYRDNCFSRVKMLSDLAITEYQIDMIDTCSFTLGILKIGAVLLTVVMVLMLFICMKTANCTSVIGCDPNKEI
ncbi:uncharacterized protein LOC133179294 [Saccostrea echinata]|uniref:uncharacterized protein LOC133179294 n=1 Tax=Saccostrea echinata TaxID=191078 RepID=UPI002A83A713|nr:uncharacterized protein LOC133179294 [Saccostrea echinata]